MTLQVKPPLPTRAWRYLQRHGLRRTLRRIADQFTVRAGPTRADAYAGLPSAGIIEVRPETIHCHLDAPTDGQIEASAQMVVMGWAAADAGVSRVEVFLDGEPAGVLEHGRARPDVADYLGRVSGAGSSGFVGDIDVGDLAHGTHLLEVAVTDGAGSVHVMSAAFRTVEDADLYDAYFRAIQPSSAELRRLARDLRAGPRVEVWVIAQPEEGLDATLASLGAQVYPNWHATVLCDATRLSAIESRVNAADSLTAESVTVADLSALAAAAVDADAYSVFVTAGETLTPGALATLASTALADKLDIVYSDHDSLSGTGRHELPWLNPAWSPDYALAVDYVGGVYLLRDTLRPVAAAALEPDGPSTAWRYDALLRLTDGDAGVGHVSQVLWSAPQQAADATLGESELSAVRAALARRGAAVDVELDVDGRRRRIRWRIEVQPKVSIIIPTTGRLELVKPCIDSLIEKTAYANYELILLDNSRGRNPDGIAYLRTLPGTVIERDEDFNWARLNNAGAAAASGELLLFLNDDIEITQPDWLDELVALGLRGDIGCVGALLLYPEGRIQHAGVFMVGYGGGAVHLFQGLDPAGPIYLDLHRVEREVSAVTGACLMVKRALFEQAGGFDEGLEIAGNDIDLCLRLAAQGKRTVWTPYSVLTHHESASRRDTTIVGDETRMWQRWGDLLRAGDPYHSPHFAKDRVDCALDARRVHLDEHGARVLPRGINLIGYIRAEMGIGEATRGTAAAIRASGMPFTIIDYQYGNPSRMADDSWASYTSDAAVYDVNLVYINADLTAEAFARLPEGTLDGRYTIGAWTWELPEFPDEWLPAFRHVDEVWVPSSFVQDAVALKSPVPVIRMPHVVRRPQGPFATRAELGLPEDAYLFLMMYDFFSVRRRKNPEGAVEAFRRAFEATDTSVGLVIKMNNADRQERELVRSLVDGSANVHLIEKTVDRAVVDSLIAATDCFVSLHRSEGFGLALAEAMALGRPVIATAWSGNVDYMTPDNSCPVGYSLVELAEDYGPYRAGQIWAEPDIDNAAWWMRELAREPEPGSRIGARAAQTISTEFSAAAVARRIATRVEVARSSGVRRGN